ncbi:hypothetical protein HUZ99_12225 [Staphylococcus sp. SS87]|nr:hypothetical protein [Staphylococcus singaporensis]
MRVSAENPAFGTPLIGFPEHKNFMSQPYSHSHSKSNQTPKIIDLRKRQSVIFSMKLLKRIS